MDLADWTQIQHTQKETKERIKEKFKLNERIDKQWRQYFHENLAQDGKSFRDREETKKKNYNSMIDLPNTN